MNRLHRILFNTLTAVSLLLAIATAGLWVRSRTCADAVTLGTFDRDNLMVLIVQGQAVFGRASDDLMKEWHQSWPLSKSEDTLDGLVWMFFVGDAGGGTHYRWGGFGISWRRTSSQYVFVKAPLWSMLVATTLPIALRIYAGLRRTSQIRERTARVSADEGREP